MTKIEFYYDPSCPWCWITSRWLKIVESKRDIKIDWKPFSLAIKNDELSGGNSSGYSDAHVTSHKILRIMEAIHAKEGIDRGKLYTAFGENHFINNEANLIESTLEKLGLSSDYAKSADDESFDDGLKQSLEEAIAIVGEDVGVPLIIFQNDDGNKQGFFGPVITTLPNEMESLELWDGLQTMATNPYFYELKRSRTVGPDVASTARLVDQEVTDASE